MTLALHVTTERLANHYSTEPSHALLITGRYGIGASTLAHEIAHSISPTIITVLPEKDEKIDIEKGTITVALIRKLYEQTRTVIDSRVIIIDYAERMAAPAQNAFLKLLEEPGQGTYFILVSHEPQKLLPTIHSRVQRLDIQPITQQQSLELIKNLGVVDTTKQTQLLYMATGLPAKLTTLATNQEAFEQGAAQIRDARELLQGDIYQKLVIAQRYKDNRPGCLTLLDVAMNMLKQALIAKQDPTTTKRLASLLETYDSIAANGNIRLQLGAGVL